MSDVENAPSGTRQAPRPVTVWAYPAGEPRCEAEGCSAEASFTAVLPDGSRPDLCWDHMVPHRDAGLPVYCIAKFGPGDEPQ